MPFKAWLDGEQPDLQRLAQLFTDGEVRVVPDDESGRYYLAAAELDRAHDDDRVYAAVETLLNRVNGAAGALTPYFQSVTYARRYTTANGDQVIQPPAAQLTIRGGYTRAVLRGPDGKPIPDPPSPAVTYVALAQSNASVDRVLGLLARDRNWWNLWKVYETIRDAVGGTATLTGRLQWVTETDVEAFRESANNPDVSGDAARHAIPTRPTSPTQTMTLPEGQAFIKDLVAK